MKRLLFLGAWCFCSTVSVYIIYRHIYIKRWGLLGSFGHTHHLYTQLNAYCNFWLLVLKCNIFMGKLEKRILATALRNPFSWFRFIDDFDMKWMLTTLLSVVITPTSQLNLHMTFQQQIAFLDTTTSFSPELHPDIAPEVFPTARLSESD